MAIDVVAGRARGAGQDRPLLPRRRPLPDLRGRGDEPRHPPGRGGGRAGLHRPSLGARRADRGPRGPRPRARWRSPRRARSTCSCRWTTWATGSTAPSSSARRRCDRPTTRPSCGRAWSRTTCRWSRPTTARSTSTTRSSSASATSARCPTACPGVEDRVDLLHDGGVVGGRISRERWVEVISAAPARMFGLAGARAWSRSGSTPTSSSTTRRAEHTISASTPPHGRRLLGLRGPRRCAAARTSCCHAAASSSTTASGPASAAGAGSCRRDRADYARLA